MLHDTRIPATRLPAGEADRHRHAPAVPNKAKPGEQEAMRLLCETRPTSGLRIEERHDDLAKQSQFAGDKDQAEGRQADNGFCETKPIRPEAKAADGELCETKPNLGRMGHVGNNGTMEWWNDGGRRMDPQSQHSNIPVGSILRNKANSEEEDISSRDQGGRGWIVRNKANSAGDGFCETKPIRGGQGRDGLATSWLCETKPIQEEVIMR